MMICLLAASLVSHVNPFVGTAATGHTTPAATTPFGLVQAGPDTGNVAWKYCSGYQYEDKTLIGFSQTHLSGTGAADLGDVRILPYTGGGEMPESVAMDKSVETASPGYYRTRAGDVDVEITATPRCAVYRMKFPRGVSAHLKFDPALGIYRNERESPGVPYNEIRAVSPTRIEGSYVRRGWAEREVFYVLESSVPFTLQPLPCMHYFFPRKIDFASGAESVEIRIALSATSIEGARRNFDAEVKGVAFDAARASAVEAWEKALARVPFPGGETDKRKFYTALYHVCFQPNLISDVGAPERYSTFSYWDTFRAAHPLYAEFFTEKVPLFVMSELEQFDRSGKLAKFSLWGCPIESMIGNHAVVPLIDAVFRGLVDKATERRIYKAVKATLLPPESGFDEESWHLLDGLGYYPYDIVRESSSRTLECSYDAACAARLAERLGEKKDAAFFRRRAQCWRNVYDFKLGFARPRQADGSWALPFDPRSCGVRFGFTEGNSWQYSWHILHDLPGLVAAMGGREAFLAKLDTLFDQKYVRGMGWTADITGEIGQYAHGNEPSHHVPWLYAALGEKAKAAARIKTICDRFYRDTPDGLCGNDDCGQLSAWFIYASLGRYPLDPCGGKYVDK